MFKRGISYWDRVFLKEQSKALPPVNNRAKKLLSANDVAKLKYLPACKMLTREFIHNSLYHPDYGYFSKQAQVFSIPENIIVSDLRGNDHFLSKIASLYSENDPGAQAWHTPTELFQPHYGIAIAKYLVEQFRSSDHNFFSLFEVGAGNGTLMKNIMEYLKENEPDVFSVSKYNIIEISQQLSQRQKNTLKNLNSDIQEKVHLFNCSIFDWKEVIDSPCFFIGLEVLDNLSHDLLRYDTKTGIPYQGIVTIDEDGDFDEEYTEEIDPLLKSYLSAQGECFNSGFGDNSKLFPIFQSNLTEKRFVPTQCYSLFRTLDKYFPRHRLLLSDFHSLPNSIEGKCGPVVQTRYENEMVPVTTYLVQPGYFDIFFPTDFRILSLLYQITNKKSLTVKTHGDFLRQYGNLKKTKTKSGDNPMVQYYENVSFAITDL